MPQKFAQSVLLLFTLEKYVVIVDVFVLRRTTRIRIKSRKLEKRAVRALEAEIDAFVTAESMLKRGKWQLRGPMKLLKRKPNLQKMTVSKVAKRANELQ